MCIGLVCFSQVTKLLKKGSGLQNFKKYQIVFLIEPYLLWCWELSLNKYYNKLIV